MAQSKRKCLSCGCEYDYCPHCDKDRHKPTWMFVFHSEQCKDVFSILEQYGRQDLTKYQAKTELSKYDLSDISMYTEGMRSQLTEIFTEEKVEAKTKAKKVEASE